MQNNLNNFGERVRVTVIKKKKDNFQKTKRIWFVFVFFGVIFASFFLFRKKILNLFNFFNDKDSDLSVEEAQELIVQVGSLAELPQNETPTIVTVKDKEKLKEQVFFKNAENGDKVLIYLQNKKAVLYRPSTNKIVETGPIFLK